MSVCAKTRMLIDQADLPEVLPFEAARHIGVCGDCKGFADERTRLRQLISAAARVSAPANFDLLLRTRLQQRVTPKRWLSPAIYIRLGAATAALLIAVVAANQTGLLPFNSQQPQQSAANVGPPEETEPTAAVPARRIEARPANPGFSQDRAHAGKGSVVRPKNAARAEGLGIVLDESIGFDNVGVLVVGANGESRFKVPAVSAGAQLPLYVNSGRAQPQSRPVQVSF